MQTITLFSLLCFTSVSSVVVDTKEVIVDTKEVIVDSMEGIVDSKEAVVDTKEDDFEAEQAPRYSCPEVDVDFAGHDIDYLENVKTWQNCGLYSIVMSCNTQLNYVLVLSGLF